MTLCSRWNEIFDACVEDYHKYDDVDHPESNPHSDPFEALLYHKCWIDVVQWHLEDIIRNPEIDPLEAIAIKRRIDKSNQDRTDRVEEIDNHFLEEFKDVKPKATARINTESPAWAIDRLSILAVKLYHMDYEAKRPCANAEHREKCLAKLAVLKEQRKDLSQSIEELLEDFKNGDKFMKVYRQMKMYNDKDTNPVLYGKGE